MAKITLPDNGQTIDLPDDIASSDEQIRAALAPLYPAIANATISREQGADGQTVVKITKVAGTKGLQTMFAVPGFEADAGETAELGRTLVRTDGGTQTRAMVSQDVAQDYAEYMQQGAVFPPITVFYDGATYWLADGFHRLLAHSIAELPTVRAYVRQGTRRDAVLYSVAANQAHGLRLTNADKRRAVETLLQDEEWGRWADHEIGRRVGVSHTFVGKVRRELSGNGHQMPQERLVQRGGQVYTFTPGGAQEEVPDGQTAFVEGLGDVTPDVVPEPLPVMPPEGPTVRMCRGCGCTDDEGCPEGCEWVEDDLCSACVAKAAEPVEGESPEEEADEEGTVKRQEESAAQAPAPAATPAPVKQAPSPSPTPAPRPATPAPAPAPAPQPVPARPLPWHQTQVTITLTFMPGAENPDDRKVLITATATGVASDFSTATGEDHWALGVPVRTALDTMRERVEAAYAAAQGESEKVGVAK